LAPINTKEIPSDLSEALEQVAGSKLALVVVYRSTTSIWPDPGNPRTHSNTQIEQIARSFRQFGMVNPLIVDENGGIIAGHGRYRAAKSVGLSEVPVIVLSHLSDAQKKALRIADNKIALNAGWDVDQLKIELAAIQALDVDMDLTLTGFSTGELDVHLNAVGDPEDERIPELPTVPRTKVGDIWICGAHRIGCGDCRDEAFLQNVVGVGAKVAAAFLDPPYNVRINGHANAKGRHREFAMASGEMTNQEFRDFLKSCLGANAKVSKDGAVHFVCMDWRHMEDVIAVGHTVYGSLLNLCVWNKSNAGMGSLYRSKHELIFIYKVGTASHFNAVELGRHGRNRTNIWDYASVNSLQGSRKDDLAFHPTVKPIALVSDALKDVTKRGELVLDTFLGSGTTLLAAER
jgi:DNA modification methylase